MSKQTFMLGFIAGVTSVGGQTQPPSFVFTETDSSLVINCDDGSLAYEFADDTMTARFVEV